MMDQDALSGEFRRLHGSLAGIRRKRAAALEGEAMAKARAIALLLKEGYGARAVLLYGSLAWGGFRQGSDLDLIVEGHCGSYWPMYQEAERLASPFEVNLVLAEEASPSLAEAAAKGGISL